MTAPVPGDIFAAYSPLGNCYTAYQFIRYQETKANQLATTHILPFIGFYARPEDIDIHHLTRPQKQMMYVGGQHHPTAFHAIEALHGYIPQDHIRIGHLPLFADTEPVIYGGMPLPLFLRKTVCRRMTVPSIAAPGSTIGCLTWLPLLPHSRRRGY